MISEPLPPRQRLRTTREIRTEGALAYVPLTRGLEALIDAADVELVAGRNWRATAAVAPYASVNVWVNGRCRNFWMHRLIIGALEHEVVDHINGDRLDNRRANLRACTVAGNMQNHRPYKNASSPMCGVREYRAGAWSASLQCNGKLYFKGGFGSVQDAMDERRALERLHFGEFARSQ